jgi:predicted HTH domain antitoxin
MASRLSPDLEEELEAVTEAGLYQSREAFLTDAVNTFLAARPDLKVEIACALYERGAFSIGRAAEWAGLSIESLKESLFRHGIGRPSSNLEEIEAMARKSLAVAGRPAR